ncbi:MAG TPA: ferrous iron transport protein B [Actinobacteria bacterium]|nr:ferrous iron transport protein B [Actinomycetota bacterium]
MKQKEITIALAGNPNSGKTTIFNNITGSRQHVGNYPGVTVEKKYGNVSYKGYKINVIDLPGTYSLTAYSEDELVARNYIINETPDMIVDIIDASNLERNLYLYVQLMELGIPLVLAFNMSDVAKASGKVFDIDLLSRLLASPIVKTVGHKNIGTKEILDAVISHMENKNRKKIGIKYGEEIESELYKLSGFIEEKNNDAQNPGSRWIALKMLEQDSEVAEKVKRETGESYSEIEKEVNQSIKHLKKILNDNPSTVIANARYSFIKGALAKTYRESEKEKISASDKIDKVLTNRLAGLPIFALLMWAMFQFVFKVGAYPMDWIEMGFSKLADLVSGVMPDGLLQSLIVDGIIGGVGGVVVFTPNIILLFLCIAILEDSGYMARVAFIMDQLMHRIGLHGKSFIPMLIGFGCTIPAYMGSRILEDKKDRLVTMHVNTFMSCGARLPIYILLVGAFFPRIAGNVIFSIYVIGIVVAILMAKLLRVTRFKGEPAPFVMELPPYRFPTFKSVLLHTWERTWLYLKKAGTIILAISILMWALFTFPIIGDNYSKDYNAEIASVEQSFESNEITEDEYQEKITAIEAMKSSEQLSYSAAGRIGRFIEPVFKPLGFDWKLAVASISGIAAKEVVVSTMGTLYSIQEADEESESLKNNITNEYSPLVGYNFMLFSLLYFPCMAGMAVFRREAGWKEMWFQIGFTLLLAWVVSFLVFQIGRMFI